MSGKPMSGHAWCLSIGLVCGDNISCPSRQLNDGSIDTATDTIRYDTTVYEMLF